MSFRGSATTFHFGGSSGKGWQLGREWIQVYLSPFAIHLKLAQHCLLIDYSPIQKKKKRTVALIIRTLVKNQASLVARGKESAYNVGDMGSIYGSGRSTGGRHGNRLAWKIPRTEEPA